MKGEVKHTSCLFKILVFTFPSTSFPSNNLTSVSDNSKDSNSDCPRGVVARGEVARGVVARGVVRGEVARGVLLGDGACSFVGVVREAESESALDGVRGGVIADVVVAKELSEISKSS